MKVRDNINPTKAYDKGGISVREFCIKKKFNYSESQAVKYITRHTEKNGKEDIAKAINNLQYLHDNYKEIYEK